MVISLKPSVKNGQLKSIRRMLADKSVKAIPVSWTDRTLLVIPGRFPDSIRQELSSHPYIDEVLQVDRPYKLASLSFNRNPTKIKLKNGVEIGGKEIIIMAGPCSIENKAQMVEIAKKVHEIGTHVLRGGAYKPRTAPYDFQGLGKIGLHFLKEAAKPLNMPVITEVLDIRDIEIIERYTDIYQVGTRNMQNYPLLRELGKSTRKPVLLKRGMWATYKELLLAAEYILLGGNPNVILCERGIRTHVQETRFTLDLNAVAYLKHETHLPVFVDPSHGTGRSSLVRAMSRAAVAAGADGLLIEAHLDPSKSISDADQAISVVELKKIITEVKRVARAVGRN